MRGLILADVSGQLPPSLLPDPKLDDQLGAGEGSRWAGLSQLVLGAGAGAAGFGAGLAALFRLADFLAFLADFFFEDFFADFLADFFADLFFADFLAFFDFLATFFFFAIDFFIFLLFFAFFFLRLAITVLHFSAGRNLPAVKHSRCGGSSSIL
ncbi:MAG: hypothetical protein J0I29_05010 [Rhizobiales bacterium]|nr:hypothetical protein [Hyphomicrobiales bacterium]